MNLQLTTYNLQLTTYNLQLTAYNLQLTTYKLQVTTYNLQLTTYNLQLTPNNSQLTSISIHDPFVHWLKIYNLSHSKALVSHKTKWCHMFLRMTLFLRMTPRRPDIKHLKMAQSYWKNVSFWVLTRTVDTLQRNLWKVKSAKNLWVLEPMSWMCNAQLFRQNVVLEPRLSQSHCYASFLPPTMD